MNTKLEIYQKVYDLILYMYPILKRMPKSERHTLSQHIRNSLIDIAKLIVEANKRKNKLPTLYQIDVELEKLRMLIRLAKDLEFISVRRYGIMADKINEIGRMLGGWIKSAS